MTVIAKYKLDELDIVFGDLLITGPLLNDSHEVTTPAQGNVSNFFGDSGWGISGLRQKVNIVSKNCVIAWAGDWLTAKIVISSLHELSKTKDLTTEDIIFAVDKNPDIKANSAQFLGLLFENGEMITIYEDDTIEFDSGKLGKVYAAGSGVGAIKDFSTMLERAEFSPNDLGIINGVAKSLAFGGFLLNTEWRERSSAVTLRSMFGGGYEIAFFSQEKMQKVAETTYLFWDATLLQDEIRVSLPYFLLKQAYIDDHLLIRSFRLQDRDDQSVSLLDEQRLIIKPMFDTPHRPSIEKLKSLSFASNILCHCIVVRNREKPIAIYSHIQGFSNSSESDIIFEGNNENWTLGFRPKLFEAFIAALQNLHV